MGNQSWPPSPNVEQPQANTKNDKAKKIIVDIIGITMLIGTFIFIYFWLQLWVLHPQRWKAIEHRQFSKVHF
jgi:hypothetical protein